MKELYWFNLKCRRGLSPSKGIYTTKVKATGVWEAKNKCKEQHPHDEIISCVKGKPCAQIETKQAGFSLGGSLLGLAAAAAVGFGAKILSDKINNNSNEKNKANSNNRFSGLK